MRILVVEDEPKLNKGIVKGLKNHGYAVDFAYEGQAGETLARENPYDVIVLDVMMPRQDGLTMCRNLRQDGVTTPILFLTARDTVDDKVIGLNEGGDDYLVKPFSFAELTARIRSLLRRPAGMIADAIQLDSLTLDTQVQRLTVEEEEIMLTRREYALLEFLLRNKDRVVSQEDILDHVWDNFYESRSNVVNVHMRNLRKKLPPAYAKRIQTIHGKGYRIS